jgi:hypothetical protein
MINGRDAGIDCGDAAVTRIASHNLRLLRLLRVPCIII